MDNDVTVWFDINGDWVDFTRLSDRARVLIGDGEPGVFMRRGAGDGADALRPSEILFTYLDSDALLDSENPASPYYRMIVPGTPVRVQCDGVTQIVGELSSIVPSWDDGAVHSDGSRAVMLEVTCTDTVGRLQQNDPPTESALTRYYRDIQLYTAYDLMHWYSFEEGEGATRVEDLVGNRPLTGLADFGNDDGPPGATRALLQKYEARTAPNPDRSTNLQVNDLVPQLAPMIGQDWALEVAGRFPAISITSDTQNSLLCEWRTFGLSGYWQILADPTTKCWKLNFYNTPLSNFTITTDVVARDDEWHMVRIEVEHSSPNFDVMMYIDGELQDTFNVTGAQTSPPKSLFIYNPSTVDGSIRPAISHLTTWAGTLSGSFAGTGGAPDPIFSYEAMLGHEGDITSERFSRLLLENLGIQYSNGGLVMSADKELGPQGTSPLMQILEESTESDASWFFAHRTSANRIVRYSVESLYNQAPTFTGTYAHLSPPFRPVPDDQIANLIKATNENATGAGSEVEYRIPDGDWYHWTTEEPPDGAWARPDTIRTNLQDAAGVVDVAAWRAHERSWREKRYTALTYDLHRSAFDAADIAAVRSLEIGKMIAQGAVGSPPWVPYHEVRGLVRGWTRTLGKQTDTWVIGTVPADIYEVLVTDSSGSTLAHAIDDNDTTIRIATSDGPPWSITTEKLQINGDAVSVSSIADMTPAYIGAGAVSHADNASVAPALPAGITPDVGQSLFIFAVVRDTAVDVNVPAGWDFISTGYAEFRLLHKYYVTGDVAPTITLGAGSAAGDTLSAVCFAFSGLSPHTDSTDGYGGVWVSSNASSTGIAYPTAPIRTAREYGLREENVVHLLLGWRADDWTNHATPASYNEMFDSSTLVGDDQAIWGAYRITTTPTAFTGQTITPSGGAAAISKGAVVALRPLQQATVTRGVANTAASHAAGAEVHAWHMGMRAL